MALAVFTKHQLAFHMAGFRNLISLVLEEDEIYDVSPRVRCVCGKEHLQASDFNVCGVLNEDEVPVLLISAKNKIPRKFEPKLPQKCNRWNKCILGAPIQSRNPTGNEDEQS